MELLLWAVGYALVVMGVMAYVQACLRRRTERKDYEFTERKEAYERDANNAREIREHGRMIVGLKDELLRLSFEAKQEHAKMRVEFQDTVNGAFMAHGVYRLREQVTEQGTRLDFLETDARNAEASIAALVKRSRRRK